jgi:hypothetical protein
MVAVREERHKQGEEMEKFGGSECLERWRLREWGDEPMGWDRFSQARVQSKFSAKKKFLKPRYRGMDFEDVPVEDWREMSIYTSSSFILSKFGLIASHSWRASGKHNSGPLTREGPELEVQHQRTWHLH